MIDVAVDAATKAGKLALTYFKSQPKVTYKPDGTPVTIADKNAEKLIRKIITGQFPDHGIIGEEFGGDNKGAKYTWVIDPIDGTKEFVRGLPFWATLLAVLENGKPIIGVLYSPAQKELFVAQSGRGTTLNGKKHKVSKIRELNRAYISYETLSHFERKNLLPGLLELCKVTHNKRSYGAPYSFNLLLKGYLDVVASASGGIWDFAAPAILVEEAGGKFSDFAGVPKIDSGNFLATNGLLHEKVLKTLSSQRLR